MQTIKRRAIWLSWQEAIESHSFENSTFLPFLFVLNSYKVFLTSTSQAQPGSSTVAQTLFSVCGLRSPAEEQVNCIPQHVMSSVPCTPMALLYYYNAYDYDYRLDKIPKWGERVLLLAPSWLHLSFPPPADLSSAQG